MTKNQILNLDYINFNNQELIKKCEQILIELLEKELYTKEEISFLNTYLSFKFAHQENIDLQIRNIEYQNYIEKFQAKPLSKKIKATKNYYEIMAESKEINEEEQKKYIHTFHIDSYSYRNSRAYIFMIIFHELRHILQNESQQQNTKIIKYENYIRYYENLLITHDYNFYEENHDRFFQEKDANIYAIIKTLELLKLNNQKLNLLDKTVLIYQTKKIFKRNTLKDRIKISEKVKETIEEYSNNFSICKWYEIEFNVIQSSNKKLKRKTINQILNEIKQEKKNSKYYTYNNYYQIDEKLFDYIVLNSIYNDNNLNHHLQTLNKQELHIIKESIKRSEENLLKYKYIIESKLKQNRTLTKDYINIINDSKKRSNYFTILLKELNQKILPAIYQKNELNKIKTKIMK